VSGGRRLAAARRLRRAYGGRWQDALPAGAPKPRHGETLAHWQRRTGLEPVRVYQWEAFADRWALLVWTIMRDPWKLGPRGHGLGLRRGPVRARL